MNIADLAITSVETIDIFDLAGNYLYTLDELQDVTVSNSEDKSDITGKHGRKLGTLKRSKAVTISGTNGLISGGLLETQTGGKFEHRAKTTVMWTDYLTVKSNAATTKYKAVGTAGAEIAALYIRNEDGSATTKLEQAAEVAEGKFTYSAETKALAFNASELEDGTQVLVKYYRAVEGDVLENSSETFSKTCMAYITITAENRCGLTHVGQIYVPKADFSGEFDLAMGDDQSVHDFEFEALAGSCLSAGGKLWDYTIFGADAEDAA